MGGPPGSRETPPGALDDAYVVESLRQGDSNALDLLVDAYWQALLRYAVRLVRDSDLAQDLVQEVFVRLWLKRHTLGAGSVRSYLYRIVHNLAVDELRKRRVRLSVRHLLALGSGPESTPDPAPSPVPVESAVAEAIEALPARRREAFVLAYLHRLSYREIGQVMGTSPATVKNQVAAALAQLRERLQAVVAALREPD